ncbi:JmjC domain-containing protein [Kribbella sp. NPDC056345]|uniref:JmjC domain-containing protein n=1 Tax=Kribbella sp. NPDC056345 TaxID=3345789 RepID=UPI0035DF0B2A
MVAEIDKPNVRTSPVIPFLGEFREDVFGRRPWYFWKAGAAGSVEGLFSLAVVDELLATGLIRHPAVQLVKDGREVPADAFSRTPLSGGGTAVRPVDTRRVLSHFQDGHTMIVNYLEQCHEPIREVARALAAELGFRVQCNSYVTPRASQGLRPHFDEHDVLVVQVHGTKRWHIFPDSEAAASRYRTWPMLSPSERERRSSAEPAAELVLEAGDCLYVRRGSIHAANTEGEVSCHLTFSILDTSEAEFAESLLPQFGRLGVRGGHARPGGGAAETEDLIRTLESSLEDLQGARQFQIEAELDGPVRVIAQYETLRDLNRSVSLSRTPGIAHRIVTSGSNVQLSFGAQAIDLPAVLTPAIRKSLEAPAISGAELEELGLSRSDALQLLRVLIVSGLLQRT